MKRNSIKIGAAVVVLLFALPALAADYSIGVRFNHFQFIGGGDFWTDYVEGKEVYEENWKSSGDGYAWEEVDTVAAAAQASDFSRFGLTPAIRGTIRFENFEITAFDFDYHKAEDIKILEYVMESQNFRNNNNFKTFDFEEWADFSIMQLKHSFNYLYPVKDAVFYGGGGLGWYWWEMNTELTYKMWHFIDREFKFSPDEKEVYKLEDDGLTFGVHVTGGVEYPVTDNLMSFFEVQYQYASATWEPENLSETQAFYDHLDFRSPAEDPEQDHPENQEGDKKARFDFDLKDSYDLGLSGFRFSFGINYKF